MHTSTHVRAHLLTTQFANTINEAKCIVEVVMTKYGQFSTRFTDGILQQEKENTVSTISVCFKVTHGLCFNLTGFDVLV